MFVTTALGKRMAVWRLPFASIPYIVFSLSFGSKLLRAASAAEEELHLQAHGMQNASLFHRDVPGTHDRDPLWLFAPSAVARIRSHYGNPQSAIDNKVDNGSLYRRLAP